MVFLFFTPVTPSLRIPASRELRLAKPLLFSLISTPKTATASYLFFSVKFEPEPIKLIQEVKPVGHEILWQVNKIKIDLDFADLQGIRTKAPRAMPIEILKTISNA